MSENKVQFGLKNVHYAVLTEGTTNSWATPVAVPGAVSLSLAKNGDATDFYADNVAYYRSTANNGYSGTLELAHITDAMLKDLFGFTQETTSKVMFEKNDAEPLPFALMFEIDGDQSEEKYCFYRCLASRPEIAGNTTAENKEVKTQSLEISCLPLVTGTSTQIGLVKARTSADTPSSTKNSWYSAVPVPTV